MNTNNPIANTAALVIACQELGIPFTFYDDNKNLVKVTVGHGYFFANSSTPFNNESFGKIFQDKEFCYRIIKDTIRTPRTIGFLNPNVGPEYKSYVKFPTHNEIIREIESSFTYPVMIKRNSGARGINIFKCNNRIEVQDALQKIYDKNSLHYDYIALAQEYIPIKHEFRVIAFMGKLVFMYEKDFSQAKIIDNISPLHQENSRAVLITDSQLKEQTSEFIAPLFKNMHMDFVGLDITIDTTGKFWLIEINSKPGFEYFVRDNGNSELVKMYKKMLLTLK